MTEATEKAKKGGPRAGAAGAHPELARGTYVYRGRCASETLARSFGVEWHRLPGAGE